MEPERFDGLAASVAKNESSRRSMLFRFGGGGVAAFLAAVGIGGLDVDEAEAKRKCKKRCKKKDDKDKRRRCKRRCRKKGGNTAASNSTPITFDIDLLNTPCTVGGSECGTGTGLECVSLVCVPIDLGDPCVDDDDCSTGQCDPATDFCVLCTEICGDPGDEVCCIVGAQCIGGACVLN